MSMPIFSLANPLAFGSRNALTHRVWNRFCERQTFAGSFSTRTACCLQTRIRAAQFMHLVIRQPGRPHLRATAIRADKFGAHDVVSTATAPTESFIVTPDSTC